MVSVAARVPYVFVLLLCPGVRVCIAYDFVPFVFVLVFVVPMCVFSVGAWCLCVLWVLAFGCLPWVRATGASSGCVHGVPVVSVCCGCLL